MNQLIKKQQGSVLLISLVLMLALTTMGISTMRGALVNEKVANQTQDIHIANDSAESALRVAERALLSSTNLSPAGLYTSYGETISVPDVYDWSGATQIDNSSIDLSSSSGFDSKAYAAGGKYELPKYYIEAFGLGSGDLTRGHSTPSEYTDALKTAYYRIIARGVGLSGKNAVMLEETIIVGTQ
ncbi:MAG: type IV pilus assembly protein PilX [Saprospiraceae bacterium]|jgi:type IV pilus assembly protein PilX